MSWSETCLPIQWTPRTMWNFSASVRLSQRNNVRWRGLIQSKRIIRTIYGWSSTMYTGEKPIYGWSGTLPVRANPHWQYAPPQCPVRRWFAFEGGLWICGSNLNWIAFMGRKAPPSLWRTYEFFSEANINAISFQLLRLLWRGVNSN